MRRNKLLISAAIFAVIISGFSGCGKDEIAYDMDETADDAGSSSGGEGLAGELGIPDTIEETLDTGNSGLTKLTIDATVSLPETDHMSVAYCTKNEMTPERRQEIAEQIFDVSEGIYVYDYENQTKSDIEETLELYEQWLEEEAAEGMDTEWIEDEIADLEEALVTAPDEYPAVETYDSDYYLGTYNDRLYQLTMTEEGNVYLDINDDLMSYRPAADSTATDVYFSSDTGTDLDEVANECMMSEDEAESIALSMLGEVGVSDVMLSETYPLVWGYTDVAGDTVQTEYDGYVFKFARAIDGGSVTEVGPWNVFNLQDNDGYTTLPVETFYVYVDDNGVLCLSYQDMFTLTGEMESDVDLLSYDELIEKANTSIAEYYMDYPTEYATIEYNGAYLTYMVTVDHDNADSYAYIPVWIFTEYEEYQNDQWSEQYPDQMVVLDARDGSYIDLKQLAKDLGTFEWY